MGHIFVDRRRQGPQCYMSYIRYIAAYFIYFRPFYDDYTHYIKDTLI